MLRHYDKIGLLKPSALLDNGYRVYTSGQLHTVSNIRLYQSCGFSLSEVAELLYADEAFVRQTARRKIKEIDQLGITENDASVRLHSLANTSPQPFTNRYDISYTWQEAQMLLRCTEVVAEADIEVAIERLYCTLDEIGAVLDGYLILFSNLETAHAYHIAIPIKEPCACGGYDCMTLEAAWYLSTFYHGDYSGVGIAYDRLLCYAQEKGHKVKQPFLERYFLDASYTPFPEEYITQISIALTP